MNFLRQRIVEFLYLPFLTYFATRSCKFCYSVGYFEVFLKLVSGWLVCFPLFYAVGHATHRKRMIQYVLIWGLLGLLIGFIQHKQYSFPLKSVNGIVLSSLMGGVLLFLFRQARGLRICIESRFEGAGENHPVELPKSLIRRIVSSSIVSNACSAIVVTNALLGYFLDTPNAPKAFQQRALQSLLFEVCIIFFLHSLISILISLELRRLFETALTKSSKSMNEIAEGNFGLRLPQAGENEVGKLLDSVNKLAEGLADRERFKNIFGKYISSKVSERILAAGDTKLGGELKNVALLMTDVKGFSAATEKIHPAQMVQRLNHDFEKIVGIVEAKEGIIDKFIGDACLAYFDPVFCDKPASAALSSARRMIQETDLEFKIGIGLHFGEVIAGNIGSPKRLEYTVIGDAVNTLARVETQTRVFSRQIILTDEFREVLVSEGEMFKFEDLGLVNLKGRTKPVRLWAV